MVVGYIFSRNSNAEFPIIVNNSDSLHKQKHECEDCFYTFLRENLLAKMLSIEDNLIK